MFTLRTHSYNKHHSCPARFNHIAVRSDSRPKKCVYAAYTHIQRTPFMSDSDSVTFPFVRIHDLKSVLFCVRIHTTDVVHVHFRFNRIPVRSDSRPQEAHFPAREHIMKNKKASLIASLPKEALVIPCTYIRNPSIHAHIVSAQPYFTGSSPIEYFRRG